MKKVLTIVCLLLLAGCSKGSQLADKHPIECFNYVEIQAGKLQPRYCPEKKDWRSLIVDDYQIMIPEDLFRFNNTKNEIAFDSNPTNDPPKQKDYNLKLMFTTSNATNCSASILGIGKAITTTNDEIKNTQGKVDYFDQFRGGENPDPDIAKNCRPPVSKNSAAYAFCSEMNGKQVLICVSQVTDNPSLAKQIFDSFRWTQ